MRHFCRQCSAQNEHGIVTTIMCGPQINGTSTVLADLGAVPGARLSKGPDSFILTYKIFKT